MFLAEYNYFDRIKQEFYSGAIIKDPYIATASIPANYNDITSVVNWDKYGEQTALSIEDLQKEIDSLYLTYVWGSDSNADIVFSKWFSATKAERDNVHSAEDQKLNALILLEKLEESKYDSILNNTSTLISNDDELEIDAITKGVSHKDFKLRNYISELDNGFKLHPERTWLKEGLIDVVTYYLGYVDESNKGTEILRVEHQWVLADDIEEPLKSAKKVKSRTKTRKWKKKSGNYHESEKVTTKPYIEAGIIGAEGRRRRQNIMDMIQVGVVTILLIKQVSPDTADAEMKLIYATNYHATAMDIYSKSGKGPLYDDIANDNQHTWFNEIIGATAMSSLSLPTGWDSKTIRDFIVEKLKGEI